jgi:hypothetical protein
MTLKPETQRDFRLRFFQLAVNHIADGPIWYEFHAVARFNGENGSMGFVTGRIYHLTLEYDPTAKWWTARSTEGPYCPYASPEAFLANWSPLEATVMIKRRL